LLFLFVASLGFVSAIAALLAKASDFSFDVEALGLSGCRIEIRVG
jgi:hypothetical protein